MQWTQSPVNESLARQFASELNVSPAIGKLLAQRGLKDIEEGEAFLHPKLANLTDPLLLKNMPEGVDRVRRALSGQEKVLIFGDYDVDGITSTALMTDFLRHWGCTVKFVVPKRLEEGYGLSIDALNRALEVDKPDLLIAVDCGTSSVKEVAFLRSIGIDVLILDHHQSKDDLPEDCLIINPHVYDPPDCPWLNLCSVGLVFKFTHAFLKVSRNAGDLIAQEIDLKEYLDLVALGTIADLVKLTDENRILVYHGLKRIRHCRRPGLCALMEVSGMKLGDAVGPFDIAFKLGPRINASGRLDDASIPIQLLLSEDWQSALEIARQLDQFNQDRQNIERKIAEAAEIMVIEQFQDHHGLILYSPNWHAGVVGIVASRISRKFHRPTIVLGMEDGVLAKGSGRSIRGVDLVELLKPCQAHLSQWGGHPMAVGMSVELNELENLREAFNLSLKTAFGEELPEPILEYEAILGLDELTVGFLQEMEDLAPFGQGNPEPVFVLQNIHLKTISTLGSAHLRFTIDLPGNEILEGVAWNALENTPPVKEPVNLAVKYHWHTWKGRKNARLTLIDWKKA